MDLDDGEDVPVPVVLVPAVGEKRKERSSCGDWGVEEGGVCILIALLRLEAISEYDMEWSWSAGQSRWRRSE
jgi:hypothetical protein